MGKQKEKLVKESRGPDTKKKKLGSPCLPKGKSTSSLFVSVCVCRTYAILLGIWIPFSEFHEQKICSCVNWE